MLMCLDAAGVRDLAPMPKVIDAVRQAMIGLEDDEFELPLRLSLAGARAQVMPVFHKPTGSVATKILSLDVARDPFITGVVTWMQDGSTRRLVTDAVTVTTLRTGAVTGVAVDFLAREDARRLTLFGAGAQSADQVRAILCVRPIEEVTIVSRSGPRAETLVAMLQAEFPQVMFTATTDATASLGKADVVACATPATEPLFSVRDLGERTVVAAIGSYRPHMQEFPQGLLADGKIYVDNLEGCLHEAGEIVRGLASGLIDHERIVPLGRGLKRSGDKPVRAVFKSVGFAVLDWAVMNAINANVL